MFVTYLGIVDEEYWDQENDGETHNDEDPLGIKHN